jgi:hypothetical protein
MTSGTPIERVAMSGYEFSPSRVEAAFSERELWHWHQSARFRVVQLDEVTITSGVVVPGDPMFGSMAALKRHIPPGTYPVSLAIVHFASGDERIAFARMLIASAPIVTWEAAWHEPVRDNPAAFREYNFYYSDVGAGCFMDAEAIESIGDVDFDDYLETVMDGFNSNHRNTWSWFSFKPDPTRLENVVCFQTEPGGRPSHFGLDARGDVVAIVTDCRMFPSG